VHLSPKAFALLQVLVEMRPQALAKADLLERVWSGVFVSEASLARVINEVRAGVDDDATDARIVRTIHGYGYAFVADVTMDEAGVAEGLAAACAHRGKRRGRGRRGSRQQERDVRPRRAD
jgi:DNA-binding winged helix-turn-helix (wHTH) protein